MKKLQKILFVDDDEDIRLIVKVGLDSMSQFNLTTCSNGKEALELMTKMTIDLVLLDVMMPVMDGPSFVAEMHRRDDIADTPFIYITAKAHPSDVATLRLDGALSVITKPFNPMELAGQIQALWDQNIPQFS